MKTRRTHKEGHAVLDVAAACAAWTLRNTKTENEKKKKSLESNPTWMHVKLVSYLWVTGVNLRLADQVHRDTLFTVVIG